MIIFVLVLIGLCLGSFVNALVWRIHEQSKSKKKRLAKDSDLSVVTGRSMCVHCGHTLGVKDLIPVLSWLSLGGKCRYCRKSISWQYPLIEILTAFIFVFSYLNWPYGFEALGIFQFICWLLLLTGFMAHIFYDLKWMILPDRITIVLVCIVSVQVLVSSVILRDISVITSSALGILTLSGLFYVLFQVSKGKWIGGGDVKLAVALGALVGGPVESLLLLFIASLLGTFASLPLIVIKKDKKHHIPFGPFLIVATIVVYLFGQAIIAWYDRQLLTV